MTEHKPETSDVAELDQRVTRLEERVETIAPAPERTVPPLESLTKAQRLVRERAQANPQRDQ